MFVPIPAFLKDYTVFNPNFAEDVVKFMGLQSSAARVLEDIERSERSDPLTIEQIESGELTLRERLNALIDRVEFIGHLQLVADAALASGCVLLGQEVNGIQWDIKALRLYLALTCIDIFCDKSDHKSHFEAVFSGAPEALKTRIQSSVFLFKADGTKGTLEEVGLFFYNVRNYYTHAGKRFHIKEGVPLAQVTTFTAGSKRHKEEQTLVVAEGLELVGLIQSLALDVAKRRFNWEAE
jgi:hypothetical protein